MNTALAAGTGTWAVAVMGGTAAQHNNFWQLLARPAGSTRWKLVTPPGTADNGGLVLALSGQSLISAFRPSQYLTYTPLIRTTDGGKAWSSLNPLGGALAAVPDALAAQPGGQLLALLASGTVTTAASDRAAWRTLTSRRALAATPPGRRCGLTALTAAVFTSSGTPLLAGACAHTGIAGIFAVTQGTWQAAGPALPAAVERQQITVLRLVRAGQQTAVLLAAGSGRAASVLVAWSAGGTGHWTVSPPLALHGAPVASASFGPGGATAIALAGHRGDVITAGHQWQALPVLPPGTATLAVGPSGTVDALAVRRARLTIWQAVPGGQAWTRTQVISVPIQFGSSG